MAMDAFETIFREKYPSELAAHLEAGADVHVRDTFERTPLLALMAGAGGFRGRYDSSTMFEMASLLMQHGADVNAHDFTGHTALQECSRLWGSDDQLRFANLFLGAGAIVRLGDDEDLYYAIANGTLALVVRLLDAVRPEGAIAELPEEFFVWAFMGKKPEVAFELVRRGHSPGKRWAWLRELNGVHAAELLTRRAAVLWGRARGVVRSGPIVGYWQHLAAAPESKAAACVLEHLTAKRAKAA